MNPPLVDGVGYTFPGQFVPQTVNPSTPLLSQAGGGQLSRPAGFLGAATVVGTVAHGAGLPKLATPIPRGAGEVGTSLIQAQSLVRSASASAVQNTFTAVASGNPRAVVNSVVSGSSGVSKSVFGDSDVPKVTPIPGTGLGSALPGSTVEPVKRLDAIRTVTQTTAMQ